MDALEKNNNLTTQQVGKKIIEHSDHLYSLLNDETKGLFHYFSALKEQIKAAAAASTDAPVPAAGAGDLDRGGAGGTGTGVAAGPGGRTGSNAALAAADATARKIKIRGDFFTDSLSPEKLSSVMYQLSSVMYQYKLIMGLNILESTKSEDDKIKELKKLMQIRLSDGQSNHDIKIESVLNCIDEFIKINAEAPTGVIAKDTPWPFVIRVSAETILHDTTHSDAIKLLALKKCFTRLKDKSDITKISNMQHKADIPSSSKLAQGEVESFAKEFLTTAAVAAAGDGGHSRSSPPIPAPRRPAPAAAGGGGIDDGGAGAGLRRPGPAATAVRAGVAAAGGPGSATAVTLHAVPTGRGAGS